MSEVRRVSRYWVHLAGVTPATARPPCTSLLPATQDTLLHSYSNSSGAEKQIMVSAVLPNPINLKTFFPQTNIRYLISRGPELVLRCLTDKKKVLTILWKTLTFLGRHIKKIFCNCSLETKVVQCFEE